MHPRIWRQRIPERAKGKIVRAEALKTLGREGESEGDFLDPREHHPRSSHPVDNSRGLLRAFTVRQAICTFSLDFYNSPLSVVVLPVYD